MDDLDTLAHLHAIELILVQLVSERLRSAPDPAEQVRWASERLRQAADSVPLETATLDEEARLRLRIKDVVTRTLEAAARQTASIPMQTRDWTQGYEPGG